MSVGWLVSWGVGLKSTAAVQDVPSGLSADKRWGNVVSPGTHRRQKMLHGAMAELRAAEPQARERASHAIEHFFLRNER